MVALVPSVVAPAKMGTRFLLTWTTVSIIETFSSQVSEWPSPVVPQSAKLPMPSLIMLFATRAASSRFTVLPSKRMLSAPSLAGVIIIADSPVTSSGFTFSAILSTSS